MANWQTLARQAARQVGVPANLFVALVRQESGGSPTIRSPAGAIGYTQLMPGTARSLGVDPTNPWQNMLGGAKYLRQQLNTFHGNVNEALAAYNAGPGAVQKYGGIPPYAETQNYVKSIRAMAGNIGQVSAGVPSGNSPVTQGVSGTGGLGAGIDSNSGVDVSSLLSVLQQQKPAPASAPLQAPAFAAGPKLPQGYQGLASSSPPAQQPDIQSLLSMVQTPGIDASAGAAPGVGTGGGTGTPQSSTPSGIPTGKVVIAPGADRPGAPIQKPVLNFISEVSGLYGHPLTIGTGTNHSKLTVNGSVSDHWSGNGADIPATGGQLIKLGQDALIAAGMNPQKARQQRGGLYNLNVGGRRVQIIFNTNGPGVGDHTTHLHVGFR